MILFFLALNFHNYYISFTEMEYNKESKSVEVSIKLTGHDLEKEVMDVYKVKLNINKQTENTEKILTKYFQDLVLLKQRGEPLDLVFDGYEYDLSGDLFVFFHYEKFKKNKPFKFEINLLLKSFPLQQNIVSFKIGEKKYQKTLTIKDDTLTSDDV